MKKHSSFFMAAVAAISLQAREPADFNEGTVEGFTATRTGETMTVGMTLNLPALKVQSNRAVLLRPVISNGSDSIELPPVALYGHRRFIYYQRNFPDHMLGGKNETALRGKQLDSVFRYTGKVPFADWMDGAALALHEEEYGCCRELLDCNTLIFPGIYRKPFNAMEWMPEMAYIWPKGVGEKTDALEGRAYVQFPVDSTVIKENFRNNFRELSKIRATIDSVRLDPDITVTEIWLKGYASPESPYSHNSDLAKGRVAAVKDYVQRLCKLDPGVMKTEFEPEDWQGLRAFVAETNLPNRDAVIELIDTDMDPDKKEQLIKKRFPADYKFLLEHSYPALRHTDYRVAYNIRRFTDIDEIKRVFRENPGKLDLNEIYLLAQSMTPGTPEYAELFDTAVRLFPNNETANLNAANTSLLEGNLDKAAARLAKAGNTAEADYARGVLAVKRGDYDGAETLFRKASAAGISQADTALKLLENEED